MSAGSRVPSMFESGDDANMPIFWYWLRRCGTLKICDSSSNESLPSVPKKPGCGDEPALPLRSVVWQPLQLWKRSDGSSDQPVRFCQTGSPICCPVRACAMHT